MADCVDDKFADNAEDGVDGFFGKVRAADVAGDLGCCVSKMRGKCPADCVAEFLFVDGAAPEVPEAVAQGFAAVLHPHSRLRKVWACGGRVFRGCHFGGIDLQGDAGQVLGERIVQLDGETSAFFKFQVAFRMGDFLAHQRPAAAFDEPVEDPVPDGDADQQQQERADDGRQAPGGPPGRARDKFEVRRMAQDDGHAGCVGKVEVAPEIVRLDDCHSGYPHPAADVDALER